MIAKEFYERPKAMEGKLELEELSSKSIISMLGNTKLPKPVENKIQIKRLWIFGVNDKQLQNILNLIEPKELIIEECRVKDLSPLEALVNTSVIILKFNTKAEKLWELARNSKLEVLHIEDFNKVASISEISKSKGIKKLVIEGGRWKDMKVKSLDALAKMEQLEYLRIMKLKVEDNSLKPLRALKQLKLLELSNNFETKEYACLSKYLDKTKCSRFKAYREAKVYANNVLISDVELTGKKKPYLNSKTDSDKLNKYMLEFENYKKECK